MIRLQAPNFSSNDTLIYKQMYQKWLFWLWNETLLYFPAGKMYFWAFNYLNTTEWPLIRKYSIAT